MQDHPSAPPETASPSRPSSPGRRPLLLAAFGLTAAILLRAAVPAAAQDLFSAPDPEPARVLEDPRGLLAWRFVTGGPLRFPPAVGHDGILYIASDERVLYAVYPTGRQKWAARLEARPAAAPLLGYDGTIYLPLENRTLLALAPNGRERRRTALEAAVADNPAVGRDGTLHLPMEGGLLLALDPFGRELWRYQLRGEVSAGPAVGPDGTLYLGVSDRRLLALEPSGRLKWQVALPGPPAAPAVGADGTVYAAAFGLHAVSPQGALLWSTALSDTTAAPVLRPDGAVAAGTRSGKLVALDAAGRLLLDLQLEGPVLQPAAALADGSLLAASGTAVQAVSPEGEILWRVRAGRQTGPPVPAGGGRVLFGSRDWILYCLDLGDRAAVPAGPWPVWLHDGHRTGRAGGLEDRVNPDLITLREMAAFPSERLKRDALREMRRYLGGDRAGRVHVSDLEEILGELVAEGVQVRRLEGGRLVNDFPDLRREGCRLLGEMATENAQAVLVRALREDPDLYVQAAAAAALAAIGHDSPDGLAPLLLSKLERHGRDEALAVALLGALGEIGRGRTEFLDPQGVQALLRLTRSGYPREVRRSAEQALRRLTGR